jgi:hypothetical protein
VNVQRPCEPQDRAGAANGGKMSGDTLPERSGDATASRWAGMPPGSEVAVERGCTCPVLDNRHGLGAWEFEGEAHYWLAETCPLHGCTVGEGEG